MRVLWLKTELLHPVDKGGKIRTYCMLRALRRRHQITYLTLDDGTAAADAAERAVEYCDELVSIPHTTVPKFSPRFYLELARNLTSNLPYAIRKYRSAAMRAAIAQRADSHVFDLLVCDFLAPSINVGKALPLPTVLFEHNVEAMIWKRHCEVQRNPLKRAYLRREWRLMRGFEQDACRRFDAVVTVSPEDTETIRTEYGAASVADVPTGVDTEYFRPSSREQPERHSLVFTGSMDWMPNEDAIEFFVKDVLPKVRVSVPDVKLTVVGRNPSQALQALGRREPSVRVTGRVEDVRPYLERAAVFIVPIRVGGGTRLKIFEAMAMERPVVSTSVGAEGLPIEDGRNLLLADTAEEFAAAVARLLANPDEARRIAGYAAGQVRERHGWDRVAERFSEVCEAVVRRKAGAVPA